MNEKFNNKDYLENNKNNKNNHKQIPHTNNQIDYNKNNKYNFDYLLVQDNKEK